MKYVTDVTKNGCMYKEISISDFLNLIDNGKKEFTGYWITSSLNDKTKVLDRVFDGISFDDCAFQMIDIGNNTVRNCSFVDCDFTQCYIHHNKVLDSYTKDVLIELFSNSEFNTFDNVKGNMIHENGFNVFHSNNVFRNMSLDGYTGLFFQVKCHGGNALAWGNNFFYNSTISLDAISSLADEARYIYNGKGTSNQSEYREIIEDIADEYSGTDDFIIDMSNMSKDSKINLVASLFTKLCRGKMIVAYEGTKLLPDSTVEFYTVDNPLPIKIISGSGKVIDISKMKDINITMPFKPNFQDGSDYAWLLYDGKELEYLYTGDSDITDSKNHICRTLIK